MNLNPYLAFNGNCEEAMTFYKECFGGEFESLSRYEDGPDEMGGMRVPEEMKEKVLHMTWRFDNNLVMASDSLQEVRIGLNISLSVDLSDAEMLDSIFEKLAEGGEVTMPPQDTFWGARFGMLNDRYGVSWMFNCPLE